MTINGIDLYENEIPKVNIEPIVIDKSKLKVGSIIAVFEPSIVKLYKSLLFISLIFVSLNLNLSMAPNVLLATLLLMIVMKSGRNL